MPCLSPVPVARLSDGGITFSRRHPDAVQDLKIPCGRCSFCRRGYAKQLGIRAWHESMLHAVSAFITLTYDDEHLPPFGSLSRRDVRLFQMQARNWWRREHGATFRAFGCGEYGEHTGRAHYHLGLFGVWFPDAVKRGKSKSGFSMFESETLTRLWGRGRATLQMFSAPQGLYMAQYTLGKFDTSLGQFDRDDFIDPRTGEQGRRIAPFPIFPTRPGLGIPWLERFSDDVFTHDEIIGPDGERVGHVAAYDRWLSERDPVRFEMLKDSRFRSAVASQRDDWEDRLYARSIILESAAAKFNRAAV